MRDRLADMWIIAMQNRALTQAARDHITHVLNLELITCQPVPAVATLRRLGQAPAQPTRRVS